MIETIKQPWPWYLAGFLIGLIVPALLLLGNKRFGISSTLRQICASCIPGNLPFFRYNWKEDAWNLFFVGGIVLGGFIAHTALSNSDAIVIAPETIHDLQLSGITRFDDLLPIDVFNWESLLSLRGAVFMVVGGFLVGFGTRYAGGCTSGHAIMGLSNLQWPSLVATICFMIGGILTTHFILPYLLAL